MTAASNVLLLPPPLLLSPTSSTSLPIRRRVGFSRHRNPCLRLSATSKEEKRQLETYSEGGGEENRLAEGEESVDFGWLPAFPHVLIASMSNFLFGYHIGVMNGPIVSVASELGFEGDRILEGLVVCIFIAGAFLGSISCDLLVDKLGCRRTFQIVTIPLILGAIVSLSSLRQRTSSLSG